jgi:hypothetical protein
MIVLGSEKASISKRGSVYLLLPERYCEALGIARPKEREVKIETDVMIVEALGKYGRFIYLTSPSDQAKWREAHCDVCLHEKAQCICKQPTTQPGITEPAPPSIV